MTIKWSRETGLRKREQVAFADGCSCMDHRRCRNVLFTEGTIPPKSLERKLARNSLKPEGMVPPRPLECKLAWNSLKPLESLTPKQQNTYRSPLLKIIQFQTTVWQICDLPSHQDSLSLGVPPCLSISDTVLWGGGQSTFNGQFYMLNPLSNHNPSSSTLNPSYGF